jgi:carbamoylphosphate synthase large subunit
MHKVLLVDTNVSSSPIYNYLIEDGNEVFVVGGNPNDFLAKSAKNYINTDYSNVDKTRELIEKLNIEYIVPGCNDRSYQVCAELNSHGKFYGIDSVEATETINNKEKFRVFATKIGLPVPLVFPVEAVGQVWPIIVKPVDAFSGRGITILHESERHELQSAINCSEEFSPSKTCLIEEYVEGQLYSHTAFISGSNIVADFIVEEHSTANPFVVDTSRVVYDFPIEMLGRIRDGIALMAEKLNLVDGLVHTQFIKNKEKYWLIEVTRRCPGDLYSQLIELSTGFNYAETYARPFIKQRFSFEKNILKQSWIMRHTISQPTEGIFGAIQFKLPIHIEKLVPISLAGDMIKASPFGRIALLFVKTNSESEILNLLQKTLGRCLYTVH